MLESQEITLFLHIKRWSKTPKKTDTSHVALSPLSVLVWSYAPSEDSSTRNHDKLSKKLSHLIPIQQDSSLPASPSPAHLLQSPSSSYFISILLFILDFLFWICSSLGRLPTRF
ncbi:hypothetical protein NC653_040888 [Populus alba x Populus x berolinensis]|uniref:Uncharacterized protein n=1 Tax=Populus alba x Populus x berolinensis TaxID=444605 RepID=A0AAD6PPA3_9ROSI|nr:hypothetical protein NC653_040888 [Populus alba x Populus x berolinensis]